MIKIRDGQDITVKITLPTVSDYSFNFNDNNWEVVVKGDRSQVHVTMENGKFTSTGSISANASLTATDLFLYCKSSKKAFGQGKLVMEMTLYAPNTNFEDGVQVLKTFIIPLDIILV